MRLPGLDEVAPEGAVVACDRVVTSTGVAPRALILRQGRIAAVERLTPALRSQAWLDAGDALLLPGVVDTHVHLNEPGRVEWEGIRTGTQAAAAGGITTLVDMPLNSEPVTTTLAALRQKQGASEGQRFVDLGFWGGVVPGNTAELGPMVAAGARGFKCFLCPSGIDTFLHVGEAELREAMPVLARLGVPLLVHAELCPPQVEELAPTARYADYLASRPASWEVEAIRLVLRLSAETGCAVHIVHLSAAEALPLLEKARAAGVRVTVETCPHYLSFVAEDIPDGATWFKCAPPIRDAANREALWRGLLGGVVDFVVCDHSPCTPALKHVDAGDFAAAWGGIASVQVAPAVLWGQGLARGVKERLYAAWTGARPAALAGLSQKKGALLPGLDADLVVWDPDHIRTLEPGELWHRHKLTPYLGLPLRGRARLTLLRGAVVACDNAVGAPRGALLPPVTAGAV